MQCSPLKEPVHGEYKLEGRGGGGVGDVEEGNTHASANY